MFSLLKLITRSTDQNTITYPHFVAFISLLNNMELIKKVYLTIADKHENREISKMQFFKEAQQFSQLTPYELNILFSLVKSFRDDE